MLKHVQISPLRNRADSLSIRSSTSCSSSLCGSPEPSECTRAPSRASSYSSLNETLPQTTIKIYTACLRIDIEYKTLGITWDSTSREVITSVLRRCKQRHRDPRLFYLSMEVTVRRAGIRTVLMLDDEARPAILQACHPRGESRFSLQMKPGGLVRVHTSALQPNSQYKSLVISEETSSDELLGLLLSCYNSHEPIEQFSLYEVFPGQEYQRKLHPDDLPLRAQISRQQRGEKIHFLVRRNPNYPRRRQILPPINEKHSTSTTTLQQSIDDLSFKLMQLNADDVDGNLTTATTTTTSQGDETTSEVCNKCRNSFKTCEFCNKLSTTVVNKLNLQPNTIFSPAHHQTTYNPVYNLREIRTVCHSFSTFGSDKKLMEVEQNDPLVVGSIFPKNKRHSFRCSSGNNQNKYTSLLGGIGTAAAKNSTTEELSQNTLKGVRNFQYI